MPWKIRWLFEQHGDVPRLPWESAAPGKEPLFVLLGEDAVGLDCNPREWVMPGRVQHRGSMRIARYTWAAALVASTIALAAIGLAVQWSISRGEPYLGDGLWLRHAVWLAVGVAAAAAAAAIPPGWWRAIALPLYGAGVVALFAVAAGLGPELNGVRRWLSIGPLTVHVAGLFDVALVLGLGRAAALESGGIGWARRIGEAVLFMAAVLLPMALLHAQPDLVGAAHVLVLSVAVLASARRTWLPAAGLGVVTLASPFVLWGFLLHGYQKERILDFLSTSPDTLGTGYQAAVAADLIRSGGLLGSGFASASGDGLERLSNARTDFAFTVLGHEWGIVGMVAVLALIAIVAAAAVRVAVRPPDRFTSRVALGCALIVAWQAGLHAGVNLGLLPVVSTPGFPLVSYGGSATVATLVLVGLLVRGLLRPDRVEAGGRASDDTTGLPR